MEFTTILSFFFGRYTQTILAQLLFGTNAMDSPPRLLAVDDNDEAVHNNYIGC